ncbi:MAG: hypothetical protein GXO99_04450 [Nitrospirae bacterium]|nr:hypothetical protein [Nitrospirota bacterium]
MKKGLKTIWAIALILVFTGSITFSAQPEWKEEFEAICSQVVEAENLTDKELTSLIERADALLNKLQKMDLPGKKVYIFRLKKCRSFFEYILQLRTKKGPK